MEALRSSASLLSSSFSSISIFSPKISDSHRFTRFPSLSKKNENDNYSDLQSDSNASTSIVPLFQKQTLSKVRGWKTGSGMEGPSAPVGAKDLSGTERISTFPCSLFTKSQRRRMRVAFTCNVCGQRTTRAINPHAYTDGTVFVQCCGCNVFHKLVDNLKLFHEMKCYVHPSFSYKGPQWDVGFKCLDIDNGNADDIITNDDGFPL